MDEQARKDAMADAETLRISDISMIGRLRSIQGTMDCALGSDSEYMAHRLAVRAASGAFRAVPGLRG